MRGKKKKEIRIRTPLYKTHNPLCAFQLIEFKINKKYKENTQYFLDILIYGVKIEENRGAMKESESISHSIVPTDSL